MGQLAEELEKTDSGTLFLSMIKMISSPKDETIDRIMKQYNMTIDDFHKTDSAVMRGRIDEIPEHMKEFFKEHTFTAATAPLYDDEFYKEASLTMFFVSLYMLLWPELDESQKIFMARFGGDVYTRFVNAMPLPDVDEEATRAIDFINDVFNYDRMARSLQPVSLLKRFKFAFQYGRSDDPLRRYLYYITKMSKTLPTTGKGWNTYTPLEEMEYRIDAERLSEILDKIKTIAQEMNAESDYQENDTDQRIEGGRSL